MCKSRVSLLGTLFLWSLFGSSKVFAKEDQESLNPSSLNASAYCDYLKETNPVGETLTLCKALNRVLAGPYLKGEEQRFLAAEGRVEQAGLIPNPALLGDYDKRSEEITVQLSQTIELGGKRGDRLGLADSEKTTAASEYRDRFLALVEQLKKHFIDTLLLQERLILAERRQQLAKEISATTRKRLEAGRGMPVENIKADLARTASELEVTRLRSSLGASKRQLAAMIGDPQSSGLAISGDLDHLPVDPETIPSQAVDKSPIMKKAQAGLDRSKAALNLALGNAYPDITLNAGVRYFKEEDKNGLVIGFGIPLPIFNRNQGNIAEAKSEVAASEYLRDSEQLRVDASLSATLQELRIAYAEAKAFKDKLLPAAEKAFSSANLAFQHGKLDYLNVLDAQRDLFNAEEQYFQAVVSYHKALADLERITGQGVSELTQTVLRGE